MSLQNFIFPDTRAGKKIGRMLKQLSLSNIKTN